MIYHMSIKALAMILRQSFLKWNIMEKIFLIFYISNFNNVV